MKANRAPRRIYVHVKDGKTFEYVRTDAFIEKACEWMRNYVNPTAGTYLFDDDIEKFRKAMRGEE